MTKDSTQPVLPTASSIEIVRDNRPRGRFRAAVFDFDGTLSLLRRNWQDVMIPMMVDVLIETPTSESQRELYDHVEEFVMRLNGRQTIYQMIHLAEEVRSQGGQPLDPLEYKHRYHDRLWEQVYPRIESIRHGVIDAQELTVPDAELFLEDLCQRDMTLYLISGTDLKYVQDELAVLGLDRFFGSRVFGALDEYQKFSKAMVIDQVMSEARIDGSQLIGFGDGFVDIEELKKVGGLAVGIASNEESRQGINAWKRDRLIRAGADIIIGDYRERDRLIQIIGLT